MAKIKLIIEAERDYDNSYEGLILGRYSYSNPGPWMAKILEFVKAVNDKLKESEVDQKQFITCYISKNDGPTCELTFKGPKKRILEVINFYLSNSKILEKFNATVK